MKQLFTLFMAFTCAAGAAAQQGYDISIKLEPYRNAKVYLGYHYGKIKALADSVILDHESKGRFRGSEPLPGGIYFIVSPSRQILFELLIDRDQHFSISADSAQLPQGVVFAESPENRQFQEYSAFAAKTGKYINEFSGKLAAAKTKKDSADISPRLQILTAAIQKYRDSLVEKDPGSFLTALFRAMDEPNIPPAADQPGGKYDSNFVYRYYKDHYWDDISFTDNRLVRTPFFEARLEKYFRDLVSPSPDSIIAEIDHMLLYSRTAEDMYRFLVVHFVQKYINPQFMGQDAVFVHLFEKYINTGKTPFFTKEYKDFATRRAYSLMANLIGRQAAPLNMVDSAGKSVPLYSINAGFTVICFWDPTCSHCKEVVPKVDSIYKAKWRNQGVAVYGVKTDGSMEEWKKFITDHKLTGWKHVYQLPGEQEKEVKEGKPGFRQLYDVYQTPMLYLLDKDKRIIAKKLGYLQIDEVINAKLQGNKP